MPIRYGKKNPDFHTVRRNKEGIRSYATRVVTLLQQVGLLNTAADLLSVRLINSWLNTFRHVTSILLLALIFFIIQNIKVN